MSWLRIGFRYLCHESCDRTGNVYEVGGGWVAQARWQRSRGVVFPKDKLTIENIAAQIDEIEVKCGTAGLEIAVFSLFFLFCA